MLRRIEGHKLLNQVIVDGVFADPHDEVVVQFAAPSPPPDQLLRLESLCRTYRGRLNVRFYGAFKQPFDCRLLRDIPSMRSLNLECNSVVNIEELWALTALEALHLAIFELDRADILDGPNPTRARAISAGTQPGERVHPELVEVMREKDFDLATVKPQELTAELAADAQWLVTMGCGDECPVVPGTRRNDWPLEDPKGKPRERVREIRDDIEARVKQLISTNGWS